MQLQVPLGYRLCRALFADGFRLHQRSEAALDHLIVHEGRPLQSHLLQLLTVDRTHRVFTRELHSPDQSEREVFLCLRTCRLVPEQPNDSAPAEGHHRKWAFSGAFLVVAFGRVDEAEDDELLTVLILAPLTRADHGQVCLRDHCEDRGQSFVA